MSYRKSVVNAVPFYSWITDLTLNVKQLSTMLNQPTFYSLTDVILQPVFACKEMPDQM